MTSAACLRLMPPSGIWRGVWRHSRTQGLFQRAVKSTSASVAEVERAGELTDDASPSFKAFLDFKFVQDNLELVKENCRKRKAQADPEAVARLYSDYVTAKQTCERLRAARNENGKAMKVCLHELPFTKD